MQESQIQSILEALIQEGNLSNCIENLDMIDDLYTCNISITAGSEVA
jgi:hypothetical protein